MTRSQRALADEVRRLLRALRKADPKDRERRTVLLRELAEVAVELREYFPIEGRPDWDGRTWHYRNYMRQLYRDANYSDAERNKTQAAVRYHAGNIVRAKLSAEELEELGLSSKGPVERARRARERQSALLQTLKGEGDVDVIRTAGAVLALLQRIPTEAISEMDAEERGAVRKTVDAISNEMARWRDAATG